MSGAVMCGTPERGPRTPYTECRHCGCTQNNACVCIDGHWHTPSEQSGEGFELRFNSSSEIDTCSWASHFVCSNLRCMTAEVERIASRERRKTQ